ncbi:hypothetical protein HDZ31DRAFT_80384 [Schizophyllum fasciatum]
MFVLVLDATGFVGFPAAQALVRAGHIHHLIPTLDVVIDAVRALAEALAATSAAALSYIHSSGSWVHGDSRTAPITDTTPLAAPQALVAWRPATEQAATALNGVVVRPAMVCGRGGSLFEPLFKGARAGRVVWPGRPGGRLPLVHCDDLADLYVRVADGAQALGGLAFDAADGISEATDAMLGRLVEVSGASGYEYKEPENLFEEAITPSCVLRPYLARSLLGWVPKKAGLTDNMEVYYHASIAA